VRISTTEAGVATAYLPNTANTAAALGTALPPATTTLAANPANWIPAVPNPTTGYPIVGYTTLELSSCYASTPVANGVIELLHALYDSTGVSPFTTTSEEVGNRGFVLVPGARINGAPTPASSFAATILSTFVTGGTKLAINNATTCTGHTGR
jgi:phosphate transport system substrate-binding protein